MSKQTYFGDGNAGPFWFPADNADEVVKVLDDLDPEARIYWLMPSPSPGNLHPEFLWDTTLHTQPEIPQDA